MKNIVLKSFVVCSISGLLCLPALLNPCVGAEPNGTGFHFDLKDESENYLNSFALYMGVHCNVPLSRKKKLLFDDETKRALYHLYRFKVCGEKKSAKSADYYRGLVFFKNGDQDRASIYLARAVEEGFDTQMAHYYLGDSLLKKGRYSKAVDELQKAVDHPEKNHAIKALARQTLILAKASVEAEKSSVETSASFKSAPVTKNAREITLVPYKKKGPPERLSRYSSKVLILHFWATWCVPCVKEFPKLVDIFKKYRDRGLGLVTVSQDYDYSRVDKFFQRHSIPKDLPVFYDQGGRLAQSLTRSTGIPSTVIFNANGEVVKVLVGAEDWKSSDIISLVENALGGKRIPEDAYAR